MVRMCEALEEEVRSRHWAATGLGGPRMASGVYSDFRSLITRSAMDDAWIEDFDKSWRQRMEAAEVVADRGAGLAVQVIPHAETLEATMLGFDDDRLPFDVEYRAFAGAHAFALRRPRPPPPRGPLRTEKTELAEASQKLVAVVMASDGSRRVFPELTLRMTPAEYAPEPKNATGARAAAARRAEGLEGWEDSRLESQPDPDKRQIHRGWRRAQEVVAEDQKLAKNLRGGWKEWVRAAPYEGHDAVPIRNLQGTRTTLEGGWEGWEGDTSAALLANSKLAEMLEAKAQAKGAAAGPVSPKEGMGFMVAKSQRERALALAAEREARKEAERLELWGGEAPTLDESLRQEEQVAAQRKALRKKGSSKSVKGRGAPQPGMFIAERRLEVTRGPIDPNAPDREDDSDNVGWVEAGDVVELGRMQGLVSGAVVAKVSGAPSQHGWVLLMDERGASALQRVNRPSTAERAALLTEQEELAALDERLAASHVRVGAAKAGVEEAAEAAAVRLQTAIAAQEQSLASSKFELRGRRRGKARLRALSAQLVHVEEVQERLGQASSAVREELQEERERQGQIVDGLRRRVEAEDSLLAAQAASDLERTERRAASKRQKEEEEALERAREQDYATRRERRRLIAGLGVDTGAGTLWGSTLASPIGSPGSPGSPDSLGSPGSPGSPFSPGTSVASPAGSHMRRRGAVTGMLPTMSVATTPSPGSPTGAAGGALASEGLSGALKTARSYPVDRFDEILLRELERSGRESAEKAAKAEAKELAEKRRMHNRLTHEVAHHGLPKDVRKWDTAIALLWLGNLGLTGAEVSGVAYLHGIDGDGLLFTDPRAMARLFFPPRGSAEVRAKSRTRAKAMKRALDYLRVEVMGLEPWSAAGAQADASAQRRRLAVFEAAATRKNCTIHCGGLEGELEDETKLSQLLEKFGRVALATVRYQREPATETSPAKVSWALVTFAQPVAAKLALAGAADLGVPDLVMRRLDLEQALASKGSMSKIAHKHREELKRLQMLALEQAETPDPASLVPVRNPHA